MAESNILRFPPDIDGGRPYIQFTILDSTETKILLPQPPGLTVQDGAVYGTLDLSLISGSGEAFSNAVTALSGDATNSADIYGEATALGLLTKESVQGAFGVDITQVGTVAALNQRVAVNKYQRTTYETQNIRSFSFGFKFAAQSKKESTTIKTIEDTFRRATYPTKVGGIALRYPPPVQVEFKLGSDPNEAMPRIFRTQITGFSTIFNQSTNAFFKEGQPIEVDMSIELQEDTQLYKNEQGVLENYGQVFGGGDE